MDPLSRILGPALSGFLGIAQPAHPPPRALPPAVSQPAPVPKPRPAYEAGRPVSAQASAATGSLASSSAAGAPSPPPAAPPGMAATAPVEPTAPPAPAGPAEPSSPAAQRDFAAAGPPPPAEPGRSPAADTAGGAATVGRKGDRLTAAAPAVGASLRTAPAASDSRPAGPGSPAGAVAPQAPPTPSEAKAAAAERAATERAETAAVRMLVAAAIEPAIRRDGSLSPAARMPPAPSPAGRAPAEATAEGEVVMPRRRPDLPAQQAALAPEAGKDGPQPAPPARIALPAAPECFAALARLGVEFSRLPPIESKQCGVAEPIALKAVSIGGVATRLGPSATVACPVAQAFAEWLKEDVVPAAVRLGGRLAEIRIAASYSCRGRNNVAGALLSEHAFANAIDISAFRIEGAGWVEVKKYPDPAAREAVFLDTVRKASCEHFTTVLGPGQAFHDTHLHLDLAKRGRRGTFRLCE